MVDQIDVEFGVEGNVTLLPTKPTGIGGTNISQSILIPPAEELHLSRQPDECAVTGR